MLSKFDHGLMHPITLDTVWSSNDNSWIFSGILGKIDIGVQIDAVFHRYGLVAHDVNVMLYLAKAKTNVENNNAD